MKFQKNQYKSVGGVAPTRYPLFIHIVKDNARKMAKFNFQKSDKNNLRIISKQHAYLQTMTKAPVKFQNNRYKNVRGVAPTRYPLSIHIVIDNARKVQLAKKVTKII